MDNNDITPIQSETPYTWSPFHFDQVEIDLNRYKTYIIKYDNQELTISAAQMTQLITGLVTWLNTNKESD